MTTKKFCGSVGSLEDFYGNKVSVEELQSNLAVLSKENKRVVASPGLFSFSVKSRVGAVPLKAVISQLNSVTAHLQDMEQKDSARRVMFKVEVWEEPNEGKTASYSFNRGRVK